MKKAVFLDIDGTINIEKNYLYKISDFEYMPGVMEGLKLFLDQGYILIVVTNQSGIARGYYTEQDYYNLERWMEEDLERKGITISGSYFCPHHPDAIIKKYAVNCDCRKPKTGLYKKAISDFDINVSESIVIGNEMRDLALCMESEAKGFLLSDKYILHESNIIQFDDWFKLNAFLKDFYNGSKNS